MTWAGGSAHGKSIPFLLFKHEAATGLALLWTQQLRPPGLWQVSRGALVLSSHQLHLVLVVLLQWLLKEQLALKRGILF